MTDQTAIYDAIDAFQRTHRLPGLQHAQIRGLLAEHLARVLPAAPAAVPSAPADADLRRELAAAERIRENADFHLGQEMARRQVAEKETARLRAVVARLRQMTDHWEQQLPEVIRTPAVVSAIRAALERAETVPSAPVDRAALLRAADFFRGLRLTGTAITTADAEAELRRMADEAQQAAPWLSDSARIGRTLIWTWADIGKGVYGQGYRAAQTEARALLTGQRDSDEAQQPETQARRGDGFEAWLKAQRDAAADYPEAHQAADGLLDLYRLHADTGTPLGEHVCEGRVAGDCECLETAAEAQQAARPGFTVEDFARMAAGADVIAGRAQLPFDQLPAEEQERHRHAARTLLSRAAEAQQGCGCPNEDAVEHQFGTADCTCIPFVREGGTARYCQPGDTVDQISGWERGGDCPHHRPPAAASQQPKEAAQLAAYQTCGVCNSGYPTGGSCGGCAFNARMAVEARQADTAGEQPTT